MNHREVGEGAETDLLADTNRFLMGRYVVQRS